MRRTLAAILLLCACATSQRQSSALLKEIADDYWRHQLDENVSLQIKFGIPTKHLPDATYAQAKREADFAQSLLTRLQQVRPTELGEDERVTLAMLRWKNQELVDGLPFFWFFSPVTPYATPIRAVNQVFTMERLSISQRLGLLDEYPRFIDQVAEVLREQQRRGILLPKPELAAVRGLLSNMVVDPGKEPAIQAAISTKVNPALQRLRDVLSPEYESQAPAGVGMSQYPGGRDAYRFLIRLNTTTELSPEEIHQLGRREVERINGEMQQVRDSLGFRGTKAEFHQFLKSDGRFFAKTPEEIGQRLTTYVHTIEPQIPHFFSRQPKAPYDVRRLDPALEGSMTFGYYQNPTATDPIGHYYYNGSKLNERNLLFGAALIAHELIPGHHFQIARQEENEQLPPFRRENFDSAFLEGWGEYSAALGNEMGIYTDPYDRYGRLMMDMLLSVRLVVDTGMNALGWSREQAAQFMRENTLLSDTEIATETLRYSVDIPAQALAYKIGSLKMLELRHRAQQQLGPRFDIRQFHEWIIAGGSMPLPILEQHVDEMMRQ